MISAVMVTVKIAGTNKAYDMELPADTPMVELLPKLLMALKSIEEGLFMATLGIKVKSETLRRHLTDGETLLTAGVWDGSIITVESVV